MRGSTGSVMVRIFEHFQSFQNSGGKGVGFDLSEHDSNSTNTHQIGDGVTDNTVINHVQNPQMVQIDLEDIDEEVTYWKSLIVCYVLGLITHRM